MQANKLFRDPVHGYISIPIDFCVSFLDNKIFQRLRRIEQTSMRVLYPSAHHDRFSHSLGVFYLGQTAFKYLKENSPCLSSKSTLLEKSFQIACLLHDCAHSPFSHTFEKYYILNRNEEIKTRLINNISDKNFKDDFSSSLPSPHEIVSAIVAVENFRDKIAENGGDVNLIARMITGCLFSDSSKGVENCLISLLNGSAIDVDKLDYIIRDTWASGVNNVKIDEQRLLSSLLIRKDKDGVFKVFFKKHALNVIHNVVEGRNFLYEWVYSHHKVEYEQYLITSALSQLSKNKSENDDFLKELFSIDVLYENKKFGDFNFYLPSDGDIIYFLKNNVNEIPEIQELLSRDYLNKALWKTKAEYNHYLFEIDDVGRKKIYQRSFNKLKKILENRGIEGNPVVKEIKTKLITIKKDEIFIDIDGDEVSYTNLFPEKEDNISRFYFIPYIPKEAFRIKKEIIRELRKLK